MATLKQIEHLEIAGRISSRKNSLETVAYRLHITISGNQTWPAGKHLKNSLVDQEYNLQMFGSRGIICRIFSPRGKRTEGRSQEIQ